MVNKFRLNLLVFIVGALPVLTGAVLENPLACLPIVQEQRVRAPALAEWTVGVYLQADNSLAQFAVFNLSEAQKALLPAGINMIVQWDQPNNNRTWRYKIVHGGRIDVGSLSVEMGINPKQELVTFMTFLKNNYPSKRLALLLWNHGYGVIDPRLQVINKALLKLPPGLAIAGLRTQYPWFTAPGMQPELERGILFDDSQNTYATNADLVYAFSNIKRVWGKNIDILGMDACLMAMIEIAYELGSYTDYLVASENVEPGAGWNYAAFLGALSANTTMSPATLASTLVATYGAFYQGQDDTATLSAIKSANLAPIITNLGQIIQALGVCSNANINKTYNAVIQARNQVITFDLPDYIDMVSFYNQLIAAFSRRDLPLQVGSSKKPFAAAGAKVAKVDYPTAVRALVALLQQGIPLVQAAVTANSVGSQFAGAGGMSIYYPQGSIDPSYPKTLFAKNTSWVSLINYFQ